MYDLNGNYLLATNVYAADGTTLQDASTVTCTITAPDATVTGPTAATHAGVGIYTFPAVTTQAGRYTVEWISTGPTDARSDTYDVRALASTALLSLTDARKTLNFAKTVNNEELRDYIDAVTALIEGEIGAVLPRTITGETVEIWRDYFYTRQPIISLTSLTPIRSGGMTLLASDYSVLTDGKIVRKDGAWVTTAPWNLYSVTYVAGRATIDSRIMQAARVLLQHLWQNQRNMMGGNPEAQGPGYGLGFTMPAAVRESLSKLDAVGLG